MRWDPFTGKDRKQEVGGGEKEEPAKKFTVSFGGDDNIPAW